MTKGNDIINATFAEDGYVNNKGLTKREYFAIQILQGMMANAAYDNMGASDMFGNSQAYAVKAADALIKALNEDQK